MDRNQPSSVDPVTAVQQQFVRHAGVVRGFILALLPDVAAAEDVLQEVFLAVTEKARTFEPGTNFVAWACTIARYKVLEASRQGRRTVRMLSPAVIESLAAAAPTDDESHRESVAALVTCLGELAPRARQVIELRYREAIGPNDIAERIGWTPNAVAVALSRARLSLRQCVERRIGETGVSS